MTEQRERQLFAEVADCFNKKYKNNMYFAMPEEDIEDAAVELADDISLKIVLGSGRNKKPPSWPIANYVTSSKKSSAAKSFAKTAFLYIMSGSSLMKTEKPIPSSMNILPKKELFAEKSKKNWQNKIKPNPRNAFVRGFCLFYLSSFL